MSRAATTPPETSAWANRKCLILCSIVAVANMQYGFDSAAIGSLQAMPGFLAVFGYPDPSLPTGYGIDSTVQQLIGSLMTAGAFLSSLVAGAFSDFLGRKYALWAACILNFIACAVQIASSNVGVLYFGRLLLGFANGFFVTFSNVYCAEASPAHMRGVMVALFAYWVNIGAIFGSVVDNYTSTRMDKLSYQIPIACLFIVPVLLGLGLFVVPESPRWLLVRGREAEARKSLDILRGGSTEQQWTEYEWDEMVRGVAAEKEIAQGVAWQDMFRGADLRRTLLCYGMIGCQTASGSWFIIAYSTYFFQIADITKAFQFSIMNTCIGFLGVNCGMYAIRHIFGRRSILILGAFLVGVSHLAYAIADTVHPNTEETGQIIVAFMALFQFSYNGGVGAASYPVATELVSSRLRAWTVGSATALGYILAWTTSFCTPYFINPQDLNWGAKYGYIWAASNAVCIVFFYVYMPEMKGRSLEELDEIFEARVPARKFPEYVCHISQEAAHDVATHHIPHINDKPSIEYVENTVEEKYTESV
ncbi:general substrate transporter [Dacryopinax primogenitus]|uniref:General substrate transporter n=1 Tax=Dacryopinax primogenitus (strain DJM 731) TaxID=1858805 RepID=M5G2M0_DACPD|nr:general substrate transporter [Dacryopinax primogenitus]EJU02939.1 general substrate transporter [Dacryopinax primogenitus]